jgi:hypothetical protein
MQKQREAYNERRFKPTPVFAEAWEREAAELLTLPDPPDIGPGGEVVKPQCCGLPMKRKGIHETLTRGASRIAEDASIERTDLLMQPSFNAVAMGIDAAESIGAANSMEKMLAHQLALTHYAAMQMIDRGLSYEHKSAGDQVEASRSLNTAARLMSAFQDGLLTLQRLRTGGNQTVTVQHVNVESGAQAVIGNVAGGRKRRRGANGK